MKLIYTWLFALLITGVQAQSPEALYDLTMSTNDLTSNGWDGVLLGNAQLSTDGLYLGPANNTKNAMRIPHNVLDSVEDFAIYARVYLESFSSDVTTLISGYEGGDQLEFSFNSSSVRVILANDEKNYFNYTLPLKKWRKVLLMRRNGYLRLVVDSAFDDSITVKQQAMKIADNALIVGHEQDSEGGSFSSTTCFNGYISALQVYRKALTNDETRKLFNPTLISLKQPFNDGSFDFIRHPYGLSIKNHHLREVKVHIFYLSGKLAIETGFTNDLKIDLEISSNLASTPLILHITEKSGLHYSKFILY